MQTIFHPPVFEDSEINRKAQVFYKFVLGTMLMGTLLEIAESIVLPQNFMRWVIIVCIYNVGCVILLYLNRLKVRWILFYFYIAFLFAMIFGMAWTAGGIKSTAIQILPLFIVMTGILFNPKKGAIVGGCVIAGTLGLVIAESIGILPTNKVIHTSLSIWINFSFNAGLLILFQYMMVSSLNNALRTMKKELVLRKNAEKDLLKSEAFRERIFDSSRIPIVVMDAKTLKYIDCNQAAVDLYHYATREEILGKQPLDFSTDIQYDGTSSEEKAKYYIQKASAEGSVMFEWKHQRPNGEQWDAEVHLMSFESENRQFLQFTLVDITERKAAKIQYQELWEAAVEGIFIHDQGVILDLNSAMCNMFKCTREIIGSSVFPFVPDNRKAAIIEHFLSGDEGRFESEAFTPDGSEIILEMYAKTISYKGKQVRMVACRDITERKQIENSLRTSEARLRFITENIEDSMWTYSLELHKFTYVSEGVYQLRGFTPEEVMNQSLEEVLTPESYQFAMGTIQNTLANRTPGDTGNVTIISQVDQFRKDGSIVSTEVSSSLVFNEQGQPVALIGITHDITERLQAEKALRESEEIFRSTFDNAPTGMSIISAKDFSYLAVNPQLCTMFGYSKEELLNQKLSLVTHPDDEERSNEWIRKKMKGEPCEPYFEKRYIHKDGHIVWGLVSSQWIKNEDGFNRMAISHIMDITARKKVELELELYRTKLEFMVKERTEELGTTIEELNSSNEELFTQKEEMQRAIDTLHATQNQLIQSEKMASLGMMAAGIAHEINNPLNFIHGGILGIENYFKDNLSDHFDEVSVLINAVHIGVKRASDIVNGLSHYSRSDDMTYEACNVNVIIENCLIILRSKLKNRVVIAKQFGENIPSINGNEGKLHQVMLNILSNAEQSITEKGIITIFTEEKDTNVVVTIVDTGSGIKEEDLQRIFDPFFTTKPPGVGTGLGLSITYSIIQEHKGTIVFESQLDKGTKAIITLPITNKETV